MTRRNMTEQDNTQLEQSTIVISDQTADTAKWYVVHTYAGHERKVALTLKQRVESAGMQNKVFKVLVPTQKKIVISEGKKRNIDERLFPGYIIVNMALDDESWYMVRSTRGVTGFVGAGTKPTPLPETEVNTLMKFMRMEAPKFEAKFSLGDAVRITDGPFTDFLGKVDEVNHEQGKVKVLVSVFGRETPVELDFLQVTGI
ncbi:MAG: Transcription antitermination protein nusG [candidate division WWE3 bacterium GW2011_GWA1_46_21]|uniref:Transcription termination/antitermination protein NusG n=3 Tax=Katanobacteria TaxID=422282 RepID=A0A0G1SAN7_UNCKA|nr:MAG: Transcription antitermination protein nusG [candidate division WWE3 bacterium GW2011_GWA1_46_21]KKU56571.1 MAG: Transcription antitermination protein nusG [candidate division WWE3 bacterium GW2011_GWB1_47_11]